MRKYEDLAGWIWMFFVIWHDVFTFIHSRALIVRHFSLFALMLCVCAVLEFNRTSLLACRH